MNKRITMLLFTALVIVAMSAMSLSVTGAADFGTGWSVQWYNSTNFTTPVGGTQSISQINISNLAGSPATGVDANFSARFTSTQNFSTPGTYQFIAVVDDGVRVVIDGVTVLDQIKQVNSVQTYQ